MTWCHPKFVLADLLSAVQLKSNGLRWSANPSPFHLVSFGVYWAHYRCVLIQAHQWNPSFPFCILITIGPCGGFCIEDWRYLCIVVDLVIQPLISEVSYQGLSKQKHNPNRFSHLTNVDFF